MIILAHNVVSTHIMTHLVPMDHVLSLVDHGQLEPATFEAVTQIPRLFKGSRVTIGVIIALVGVGALWGWMGEGGGCCGVVWEDCGLCQVIVGGCRMRSDDCRMMLDDVG